MYDPNYYDDTPEGPAPIWGYVGLFVALVAWGGSWLLVGYWLGGCP
jgi:hypothetical protein